VPDATVEGAAKLMVDKKIGGLPVLDEGVVIGIITDTDLLAHLTDLLGEHVPGIRVTLRAPEKIGVMAAMTNAIAEQGWGIYAGGYVRTPKMTDCWDYVFKVRCASQDELARCASQDGLAGALEQIDGVEILDIRETE
jgi:acetoin utilization protein AcuB